jgi:type I restriction enzyme R subunit
MSKEAKARIKINEMLKEAGWKFFDDAEGKANIVLENNVKITESHVDAFGENFETTKNGFIDFLLLDKKGFPFIVLEAKSEDKHAWRKEQARKYALSQHCCLLFYPMAIHIIWDTRMATHAPFKVSFSESVEGYSLLNPTQGLIREVLMGLYCFNSKARL